MRKLLPVWAWVLVAHASAIFGTASLFLSALFLSESSLWRISTGIFVTIGLLALIMALLQNYKQEEAAAE